MGNKETAGTAEPRGYEYPPEQCDVADRSTLLKYRGKRSEWLHLMVGDLDHAVWTQINSMLWNDAVFRMINETRGIADEHHCHSAALNGPLAKFIDQGYVSTQTLSIRKLLESAAKKPIHQVISLRRVLDDIKDHRHLITREIYVCHDGLPFDPTPACDRFYEKLLSEIGSGKFTGSPTKGPGAFAASERAHLAFDRLAGVRCNERGRDDLILPRVFDTLEAILADSGWTEIKDFANKFLAHAADEYSRNTLTYKDRGLSLDHFSHCHAAICRVASAIYGPLLFEGGHGLLPLPQFDQFEYLDSAWISAGEINRLRDLWERHVQSVEAWGSVEFLW